MFQSLESRIQLIDNIHNMIRENSGRIRTSDLDKLVGNKQDVRVAITRLTVMGKISRRRGLGAKGVEYFYHDVESPSFEKHRKMANKSFAASAAYGL